MIGFVDLGVCKINPVTVLAHDDDDLGVILVDHGVIVFVNDGGRIWQRLMGLVDGGDDVLKAVGAFVEFGS